MKKIILTGGGTAGHVTPNLALVPTLKSNGWDIEYIGLLVIGRDSSIHDTKEIRRLSFRTKMTVVNSKKIHCVTYDQLLEDLKSKSSLIPQL